METGINKVATYLEHFLNPSQANNTVSTHEVTNGFFPLWITQIARIHEASIANLPLILIEPKEPISVDQGARLHKVVTQTLKRTTLLIADQLPPKGRGTLVRLQIPHVIGNHTVYAPDLGLQYRQLPKPSKIPVIIRPKLSALAVKLAAYYLRHSKTLQKTTWTLSEWHKHLSNRKPGYSLASLSRAFTQLIQMDLMDSKTLGVSKQISFIKPADVWLGLANHAPELISKRVTVAEKPSGVFEKLTLLSGESALSKMTDLNEPRNEVIAMDSIHWKLWSKNATPLLPNTAGVVIEVWEGNSVFSPQSSEFEDCINPILLALSLRHETDPRIQIALKEVLTPLGLEADILWRRK